MTLAVLFDLTSAFDCVDHRVLKHKLNHYGVNNTAFDWLSDYLSNRSQYVTFNGVKSSKQSISTGVPQGSILGPILFLIYINDFNNAVNSGTQLLFADDANHYLSGYDIFTLVRQINNDLKLIHSWFRANNLSVNIIKSEAILFSRRLIYFPLPPILLDTNPIPYCYFLKKFRNDSRF